MLIFQIDLILGLFFIIFMGIFSAEYGRVSSTAQCRISVHAHGLFLGIFSRSTDTGGLHLKRSRDKNIGCSKFGDLLDLSLATSSPLSPAPKTLIFVTDNIKILNSFYVFFYIYYFIN